LVGRRKTGLKSRYLLWCGVGAESADSEEHGARGRSIFPTPGVLVAISMLELNFAFALLGLIKLMD